MVLGHRELGLPIQNMWMNLAPPLEDINWFNQNIPHFKISESAVSQSSLDDFNWFHHTIIT
jgi:hypothetical protein